MCGHRLGIWTSTAGTPAGTAVICGFGLLLCGVFGKMDEGREMARAAELILAKHDMKEIQSRVILCVEAMVFHWTGTCFARYQSITG